MLKNYIEIVSEKQEGLLIKEGRRRKFLPSMIIIQVFSFVKGFYKPGGIFMNGDMLMTFIILVTTIIIFLVGKIRSDLVAFTSLLAFIITGVLTPNEALNGFSEPVIVMIAGLFVVGIGIYNTGLARMVGQRLLRLGGNNEKKLLTVVMIVVALLSAVMSNTGTVAILLPIIISLSLEIKISPSKFLIPLAFASSLGGALTMIGTPPNLIASKTLSDFGFETLSFFDFTQIGAVGLIIGILYMITIGRKLIPNYKIKRTNQPCELTDKQLSDLFQLNDHLHFVKVTKNSRLTNKKIGSLAEVDFHKINIVQIERYSFKAI